MLERIRISKDFLSKKLRLKIRGKAFSNTQSRILAVVVI